MMRNTWQGRQGRILNPVPDELLPVASVMWRGHFGGKGRFDPVRGIVAVTHDGQVVGVMGLRDAQGGFMHEGGGVLEWLYRPAPATDDLVVDGIAVRDRRTGIGQALIQHACQIADQRNFPGLRAEVRDANLAALAFYKKLGFVAQAAGRYGLPWWGQVHVLRRDAVLTEVT